MAIKRSFARNSLSDTKTEASYAVLPVPTSLLPTIMQWPREKDVNGRPVPWLFPSRKSASGLFHSGSIQQKILWPACDKAKLPRIGWHGLRYSYRSWLDAAQVTMGVSKDVMRHADISTTMNVYGHSLPAGMKDAAEAVAGLLA